MGVLASNIKDGVTSVISAIGFGISSVVDTIGTVVGAIGDGISTVVSTILEIPGAIVDLLKGLLEDLFVPSSNKFGDIKQTLESKFPLIAQVGYLMSSFLDLGSNAVAPKFEFSYQGSTVSIVDFSSFSAFLPMIQTIIVAVSYFGYFFRLYKKLPSLIYGFTPL